MTDPLVTIAEIASASNRSIRAINIRARKAGWPSEQLPGSAKARGYRLADLPPDLQRRLIIRRGVGTFDLTRRPDEAALQDGKRASLWAVYDQKPEKIKARAKRRLDLVIEVTVRIAAGDGKLRAAADVAKGHKISAGSVRNWLALIAGVERADWLPALAPRWSGRTATTACSVEAWDYFKADYLRLAHPTAKACYERLLRAAAGKDWAVPACKTLMRRLERELHPHAIVAARQGSEALKRSYPAQERDHGIFSALEAVNADGHKFDIFARWLDGYVGRPIIAVWQDVYSGKILAWRIGKVESAELVRLAFADLVEKWGIPTHAWMDNGRGFAAKWITGGVKTRYRFKVKEEEPLGVLPQLGVRVHWTQPYSGQSKPIERAFQDFCEYISKHPRCEGAYCGNRPGARPEDCGTRIIPIAEFIALVESEIHAHNKRQGRRSPVCAGRSFDEVFDASYATAKIGRATEEQRRLLLLAADAITCKRDDASVSLMGNRYWSDAPALARAAGGKVVVRFDPQNLELPVFVYTLDGRFIATCPCVERAGFGDVEAGKAHARARNQRNRAVKDQLAAERRMSTLEVAAMLPSTPAPDAPEAKVVRPLFRAPGAPKAADEMSQAEADQRLRDWTQRMRKQRGIER